MNDADASAGRPDLSGMRVLFVEDEFNLAVEMAEQIEQVGGAVIGPFARCDDALAALARSVADCALVDINLGGGPMYVLTDALVARGVPFVFLTGYDADALPGRFRDVTRIEKPARLVDVLEALSGLRGRP